MQKISHISDQNKSVTAVPAKARTNSSFKPFFQPKLTINQPNDVYEQEADAMADKVMRMTNNESTQQPFFKPAISSLQRKCSHCEEEEKQLQRKETNNSALTADNKLTDYTGSLSGYGHPLPGEVQQFFEPRFGYDFSKVKVHTDNVAADSAQSINALAYTSGNNIVFNNGQYAPETCSGKRLLAHELTHVVQQQNLLQAKLIQRARLPCTSGRDINIYLVSLPGSTRDPQADVDFANNVLCQCGIHLNVLGGETWDTNLLNLMAPNDVLNESASHNTEMDTMLSYQPGGADVFHVYFVPDNTLGDRGGSYGYPGVLTGVPLSVSVTNSGVVDTLAHEMLHILLQDGSHHSNADNLLAAGRRRRVGVDELEQSQCDRII